MKQAVVLIHGIGEQKPMDTLRAFVSAVLPPAKPGHEQYWNKPDPMAELFELRRLQKVGRPGTHFFEYYWAYHVEGTEFRHLLEWLFSLVKRKKTDVPDALSGVWWASRFLLAGFALTVLLGGASAFSAWQDSLPKMGVAWFALSAVFAVLQYFLIYYLGDAARYLSPQPGNIELRQKIRAEGTQLLRKLHESGEYDRIIVVGHSLGSVIGYDIITRLWHEYNETYSQFTGGNEALHDLLVQGEAPQPEIRDNLPGAGAKLDADNPDTLHQWRDCQRQAWLEQRQWGNPWLISDFITLGSPLAHAMLLQANSADDFAQRQRQRELSTCPPVLDEKGYGYGADINIDVQGKLFKPLYLHHAAAFAVTRWTNLYFPVRNGLGGDFIGGPLRQVYGLGIKDIPVHCPQLREWHNHSPLAHTEYWHVDTEEVIFSTDDSKETLAELRQALSLEQLRKYVPKTKKQPEFEDELLED